MISDYKYFVTEATQHCTHILYPNRHTVTHKLLFVCVVD